ncbi:siderophore-interacting protein [Streptomyces sp. NPDC059096]|uniref:siderophore-interacting protein n=1 Tax=Streptomyces sp. NPDC059096 TaxID=3346727 RepID=UPI00369904F0
MGGFMAKVKAPARRSMVRAEVARTARTGESFVTLTLAGPGLADFEAQGFDQCCRLFFRREGQSELAMPTASHNGWLAQYLLMRPSVRPWVRNYTVRAFRPEALELDIEFALHGDAGPASAFAARARPGEPVGLFDEGIGYLPAPDARSQFLVADESAVPAVLAVLESAPEDLVARVLLEVPHPGDIRDITAPPGVEVRWLHRDGRGGVPGRLALHTAMSTPLPEGPFYTWVAGESGLATGLRRYLVKEREVPKSHVSFLGYWKHGRGGVG